MRVSVTERQLFKRCRRKWEYSSYNRMSLQPILNAPALDLGTLIHATLAEWTLAPDAEPTDIYNRLAAELLSKIKHSYIERIGCNPSTGELEPTLSAIMLGNVMITNYKNKWHTPLPPGFTLVENELSLVQPVPNTEHCCHDRRADRVVCKCPVCEVMDVDGYSWDRCINVISGVRDDCICHEVHMLECTFDGVMADENGDLYIIERKTFSRTPSLDELNNNDQFLAYQWALSQQLPNVVGLAYDGLLKKEKPPAGKTYDDLFLRRILLRNKHELDEFALLLAAELNEMASPTVPIYKNVPPVTGCQTWECGFIQLCHATSKGEPTHDIMKMYQVSTRKKHLDIVEA